MRNGELGGAIRARLRYGESTAEDIGGESGREAGWDKGFENFRKKYPSATFAEYYVKLARQTVQSGKAHPTLGKKLNTNRSDRGADREFREAAQVAFDAYRRLADFQSQSRVIDYGCGSLRLGVHFIEYLDPGNYMGLDVTRDFIDIGIDLVGRDLIREKAPRLDAITEVSVATAAAFEADYVISNSVSFHVHPDELETYCSNLARMTSKPGGILLFNAKLSAAPTRYSMRGWATPLEDFTEWLKPLTFIGARYRQEIQDYRSKVVPIDAAILEFRRD